jgi:hypothetical protein
MQTRQGSFLLRSGDAFSYDNKEELRSENTFSGGMHNTHLFAFSDNTTTRKHIRF